MMTWRVAALATMVLLSRCAAPPPRPLPPLPVAVPAQYANVPRLEDDASITRPKPIRRIDPAPLRGSGGVLVGSASIELVIDETGHVVAAWYTGGDRLWARQFLDAARQWQWEPATRDGRPLAVRFKLTSTVKSTPR